MKNVRLALTLFIFFTSLISWEVTHAFATQAPISGPITAPIATPTPSSKPITSPITTPTPTANPNCSLHSLGDIDCDGKIGIFDYNILITNFAKIGTKIPGDIDCNGKVDIFDYNILVTNFGKVAKLPV